jgi:uncharacterized protein (DUF2132 family)
MFFKTFENYLSIIKKFLRRIKMLIQANNPLHGITLENILKYLLEHFTWDELHKRIRINCFCDNPSIQSSLKFLRKTPWARKKVENLYLRIKSKYQ